MSKLAPVYLTKRLGPLHRVALLILLSVLIVVGMTLLRPAIASLGRWGYVAAFTINLLSTATIVLPTPGLAAVLVLARDYNPLWLGVAAGLGGTLGEMTGYWLGSQGREPLQGKRVHTFMEWSMNHFGGRLIFLFALLPVLPVDLAGVIAGATRYPIPKFLLYVALGKIILMVLAMYAVAKSITWAEPWLERMF